MAAETTLTVTFVGYRFRCALCGDYSREFSGSEDIDTAPWYPEAHAQPQYATCIRINGGERRWSEWVPRQPAAVTVLDRETDSS